MRTNNKRLSLIAVAVVGLGVLTPAATASADSASFIDYLDRKGMDVSTADIRSASVELGRAICGLYDASQSHTQVTHTLLRDHSPEDAAIWDFGSVHFLCPQWEYLLP
jgi:hypothetical protein